MADDLGERTEDATPKRQQEAREEGQVAKSQDLSAALLLAVVTVTVAASAMWMLDQGRRVLGAILDGDMVSDPLDPAAAYDTVQFVAAAALRIMAPVVLIAWLGAYLSHFGQIGWLFAPKAIVPKMSKLNPISGFKRVFGISGLVKACLDSAKVALVVTIVIVTVHQFQDRILVLPYLTVLEGLADCGWMMLDLALRIIALLLVLGVIDFAYQKWKHAEDMKMSKQQVREEMKETEGDPETKKRRMRIQQQIAMQRISSAVPKADVIVTNPEHISVALEYDETKMNAPRVVAKGADHLAFRIRQIAIANDIPIVERKPLARALYRDVQIGQEVPPDFYSAVAEVLAYVYRLSGATPRSEMAS